MGVVLFFPAGSAQASWFSSNEKPKNTKQAPAANKMTAPGAVVRAVQIKQTPAAGYEAFQSKNQSQVQNVEVQKGHFFDLGDGADVSKFRTKEKPTEPVRASSEETEKIKKEMLKLKRDINAARGVKELPKLPSAPVVSLPPPRTSSTAPYKRPAMLNKAEINPPLPPLELARKK